MRLIEGSSRAAGGVRILPVDIDDVLMLFLCCRFELCSPGSFENGMNSQLKCLMLDNYDFRTDRIGPWDAGIYWKTSLEGVLSRMGIEIGSSFQPFSPVKFKFWLRLQ
jgi:hypothetical protein